MAATPLFDLRGLRDRAILFLSYTGGLGLLESVGLDADKDDTSNSGGRIEIPRVLRF
jgi:site-specific recombinase XerC